MDIRKISIISGISYLIIFFAAIFANFFVLEAIIQNPLETIQNNDFLVRLGIMAFLITVIFDVVVAWGLYELYKNNILTKLSTYFRLMHAVIFGVAVFALPLALNSTSSEEILAQVEIFNLLWLIGLFFFGIHLVILGKIFKNSKIISGLLMLAGIMYVVDTSANILMSNYDSYADTFLLFVAIPSIIGEMSLAVWLLVKGGKTNFLS